MAVRRACWGVLLLGVVAGGIACAEPVDVRQGPEVGSGFTFGRGETCTLLTAGHVVRESGVDVLVTDRTGGRATGHRVYYNEAYDLALVELPQGSPVACRERWPDARWMSGLQADNKSMFEVVRHYPGGRELLVMLRYAGGSADRLTLAFVDKLRIVSSDSGSIARLEGRLAGIVVRVITESDRVEVLRFDVIDRLVGERFKGAAVAVPIAVDGVLYRGRVHPTWTTYLRSWLTERAGRTVVELTDSTAQCRIGIEVIEWKQMSVPNPEYGALAQKLEDCKRNLIVGLLGRQARDACERPLRDGLRTTPRNLSGHQVMLNLKMTPKARAAETKLVNAQVVSPPGTRASGAEVEMNVLYSAIAPTAEAMFKAGACE